MKSTICLYFYNLYSRSTALLHVVNNEILLWDVIKYSVLVLSDTAGPYPTLLSQSGFCGVLVDIVGMWLSHTVGFSTVVVGQCWMFLTWCRTRLNFCNKVVRHCSKSPLCSSSVSGKFDVSA
jgi:hypothetical protein